MSRKTTFLILAGVFAVMTFLDLIDGYVLKLVSSLSITLALLLLAIADKHPRQKQLHWVVYGLLMVAAGAFVYRLINWYA